MHANKGARTYQQRSPQPCASILQEPRNLILAGKGVAAGFASIRSSCLLQRLCPRKTLSGWTPRGAYIRKSLVEWEWLGCIRAKVWLTVV